MFVDSREERALCTEAVVMATDATQRAGMVKEALETFPEFFLPTREEILRRALTGKPPVLVEVLRLMLKPGVDVSRANTKLRPMPP